MKILVACEESQAVTIELRKLGHEAYSNDIIPCSGGHPEWHIRWDAMALINGNCTFLTEDWSMHTINGKWDMIIAFPPCTYLTVTGNRWFNVDRYGEAAVQRHRDREDAIKFFMAFANADCDKIAIENPVGIMSSTWRKPNQIINPYEFGDPFEKKTCLWLKGLPELKATNIVEAPPKNTLTVENPCLLGMQKRGTCRKRNERNCEARPSLVSRRPWQSSGQVIGDGKWKRRLLAGRQHPR